MEKLEYSRYYTNINKEWVYNSTKSGDMFSYTNGAYEISVEFCVVKFSSFEWSFDGVRNKEWEEPKLGDAHGTPR